MSKSIGDSPSVVGDNDSKYIDGINEERFDLFLKDLRSGELNQGKGALHTIDLTPEGTVQEALCCLGVACLRPAAEGVINVVKPDVSGMEFDDAVLNVRYNGYNTVDLPIPVADYLGIPEVNRVDKGDNSCNVGFLRMGYDRDDRHSSTFTAIGLNDTLHKNFAEIADAFEKEFLK